MNIYLNEDKPVRDDTIEPAYLKNPASREGSGTSDAALEARVSDLESKYRTQNTKITNLTVEVNKIKASLSDLPEGTTVVSVIKNYITTVIGRDVPASVTTEEELATWLAAQEDGKGMTLDDLNERIKTSGGEIITTDEIENLVDSLP